MVRFEYLGVSDPREMIVHKVIELILNGIWEPNLNILALDSHLIDQLKLPF